MDIYIAKFLAFLTIAFTAWAFSLIALRVYSNRRYDKKFNIKTQGTRKAGTSSKYNRTESTPYSALFDLSNNYAIPENFGIVDYGSGQGRSTIMLHHLFKTNVTGVEVNKETCDESIENYENYKKIHTSPEGKKVFFLNDIAENYEIKKDDRVFFIFNSFYSSILKGILEKIIKEANLNRKEPIVILYYPTKSFIKTMNEYGFELEKEIKTKGSVLKSEKFLVYKKKFV